jgi:hypothetical protein
VYGAKDNLGDPLALLNVVPDPDGGYLGVYDYPAGGSVGQDFVVALAHSADLLHWTRLGILDAGATTPTLERIWGTSGYLFTDEKFSASPPYDHIRLRYYANLQDVINNLVRAQIDLPLRYSPYGDGTPNVMHISWRGGLHQSVIELGFHYLPGANNAVHQGPDREALGTLRDFRTWKTARDISTDRLLDSVSIDGKHGNRSQFSFGGQLWRVYEGQTSFVVNGFSNWRVILENVADRKMVPLSITTAAGAFASSFGSPIVHVVPAPGGASPVLLVTMYVFYAGPAEGGELIYDQPLAPLSSARS